MSNPLLDDSNGAFPPVPIALPTLGRFYTDDILDSSVNPLEIPVNPLSLLDDSLFRDPVLLATGRATSKLIKHVCPMINKPEELAEIDVEAILLASRMASSGTALTVPHQCENPETIEVEENGSKVMRPVCGQKFEVTIDLHAYITRYAPFDDDMFGLFQLRLDNGQTVQLQPISYGTAMDVALEFMSVNRQFMTITPSSDSKTQIDDLLANDAWVNEYSRVSEKNLDLQIKSILNSIKHVLTSTNKAIMDRQYIEEWLLKLPIHYTRLIRERVEQINLTLRKFGTFEYNCPHCNHVNQITAHLDPQRLFTFAEGSDTPKKPSAKSTSTGRNTKTPSRLSRR